eukprot:CAMPEP_0171137816 /NCGR_PEP_ID=MMETSP0766_2-20121228/133996_1 /TAXON_ID=439317 /ORGANISM="Gambierdiscus australes, Strain CAWD 149" /LENGTH=34 /DNA_ID= /DNA_START= /DNA_END= /DNA_ORIENTATION=
MPQLAEPKSTVLRLLAMTAGTADRLPSIEAFMEL